MRSRRVGARYFCGQEAGTLPPRSIDRIFGNIVFLPFAVVTITSPRGDQLKVGTAHGIVLRTKTFQKRAGRRMRRARSVTTKDGIVQQPNCTESASLCAFPTQSQRHPSPALHFACQVLNEYECDRVLLPGRYSRPPMTTRVPPTQTRGMPTRETPAETAGGLLAIPTRMLMVVQGIQLLRLRLPWYREGLRLPWRLRRHVPAAQIGGRWTCK